MTVAFWVNAISMIGTLLTSFYVFKKSVKYSPSFSRKVTAVLWCALWAALFAADLSWLPNSMFKPLMCAATVVFLLSLTEIKPDTVISAFLLSFGISYVLYYIGTFITGIMSAFLIGSKRVVDAPIDFNQPLYLLIYALSFVIQLFLAILFFRIRRFQSGFPFVLKHYAVIISLISAGVVLLLSARVNSFGEADNAYAIYLYFAGILIAGVGIYIWVRRSIRMYQIQRSKHHAEYYYLQKLAEKDEKIHELEERCQQWRIILHEYAHRIEMAEDLGKQGKFTAEDAKELQEQYQNTLLKIKTKKILPTTKVRVIDQLFQYYSGLFLVDNIDFNIKINGSIPYMTENVIEKHRLETMIADHLKDALIAVKAGNNPFRSVFVILGLAEEDAYEFVVYDTGIPFEVDTLTRLGTECVTTHAESGGTGIGFMTTFETMRECGASLIINEKKPSPADYTKSITIRFDGKKQYTIQTYRPNDFPPDKRYIVRGYVE